jgi:hypothetical protein
MFGAQGLWAGRVLYRVTSAATRGLGFSGLILRTAPFGRLLRLARGCRGPIVTRINQPCNKTFPLVPFLTWSWVSTMMATFGICLLRKHLCFITHLGFCFIMLPMHTKFGNIILLFSICFLWLFLLFAGHPLNQEAITKDSWIWNTFMILVLKNICLMVISPCAWPCKALSLTCTHIHGTWSYLWYNHSSVQAQSLMRIVSLTWLEHTGFSADCSVTWFWHTNFDCSLFRLLDAGYTELDSTWYGDKAHGGCDRSAEDAYSSMAPDPTFIFFGGPCCLTLDFVFAV